MGIHGNFRYHGNFDSLEFPKTGEEIIEAGNKLHGEYEAKLAERTKRITAALEEAGLTTADDVLANLENLSVISNSGRITAGLSSKLQTEQKLRMEEEKELRHLKLMLRNLPKDETFNLTFNELLYFKF